MNGQSNLKNSYNTNVSNLINNKKIIPISRNYKITPNIVGKTFKIYNGKIFIKLTITDEMIGHKVGEFIPTRIKFIFKKKRKTNKK